MDSRVRSVLVQLGIGMAAFLVVLYFVPLGQDASLFSRIVHNGAVLLVSLAVPFAWKLLRHMSTVVDVLDTITMAEGVTVKPIEGYARYCIEKVCVRLKQFQRHPGVPVSLETELQEMSRVCFKFARTNYYGIDSHKPSVYLKRYEVFLSEQEGGIHSTIAPNARILAVNKQELEEDFRRFRTQFDIFHTWHIEKGILLLQIEQQRAAELAEISGVDTVDVGLWPGYYALFFRPNRRSVQPKDLGTVQFLACTDAAYREARHYLYLVSKEAVAVEVDGERLVFRTRDEREVESIASVLRQGGVG